MLIFGIIYSTYLSFYTSIYTGFVLILITVGFAGTIYMIAKKVSYKIIFYVWMAIIVFSVLFLILQWSMASFASLKLV